MQKKSILLIMTVVAFLVLFAGCGSNEGADGGTAPQSGEIQEIDPVTSYATLAEAEAAVGFTMDVPSSLKISSVSVVDGNVLEVVGANGAATYTYRQAAADADIQNISGVYEEFEKEKYVEGSGGDFTSYMWNPGGSVLVTGQKNGYVYSVYCPQGGESLLP